MIDSEVGNSVKLPQIHPAEFVADKVETSEDDKETSVGHEDLRAVSSVKDDGGRIEICRITRLAIRRIAERRGRRTIGPLGVGGLSRDVEEEVRRPTEQLSREQNHQSRSNAYRMRRPTCWNTI